MRALAEGEESGESVFALARTSHTQVQLALAKSDKAAGVCRWVDVEHFLTRYVLAEKADVPEKAPYCF